MDKSAFAPDRYCLLAAAIFWFIGCSHNPSKPSAVEKSLTDRTVPPESSAIKSDEPHVLQAEGTGGANPLIADYDNPNRAIWQKPELVISQLGDLSNKTVADIGAGTGYFAFRLATRAKKVIAIEIDRQLITFMDSVKTRLPEALRPRFETRLSRHDDPLLAPAEADAVTIVNTIGYIEHRVDYLKKLRDGMATGGLLLIIDFKKDLPVGPAEQFKVGLPALEAELRQAGFEPVREDVKSLDYQYILLSRKL